MYKDCLIFLNGDYYCSVTKKSKHRTMNFFRKINDDTWVEYDENDCPDFKHFIITMAVLIGLFILIVVVGYLTR